MYSGAKRRCWFAENYTVDDGEAIQGTGPGGERLPSRAGARGTCAVIEPEG